MKRNSVPLPTLLTIILASYTTLLIASSNPLKNEPSDWKSSSQHLEKITLCDYCTFLNTFASTDAEHLYDEKMAMDTTSGCIIRSGQTGNYHYEIIAGKEEPPITGLSELSALSYSSWKEEEAALSVFTLSSPSPLIETIDLSLRSNILYFGITPFTGFCQEYSGAEIPAIKGLEDTVAFSVIFLGGGVTEQRPNLERTTENEPLHRSNNDCQHHNVASLLSAVLLHSPEVTLSKNEGELQDAMKTNPLLKDRLERWSQGSEEHRNAFLEEIDNSPQLTSAEKALLREEIPYYGNRYTALTILKEAHSYYLKYFTYLKSCENENFNLFAKYNKTTLPVSCNIKKLEEAAASVTSLANRIKSCLLEIRTLEEEAFSQATTLSIEKKKNRYLQAIELFQRAIDTYGLLSAAIKERNFNLVRFYSTSAETYKNAAEIKVNVKAADRPTTVTQLLQAINHRQNSINQTIEFYKKEVEARNANHLALADCWNGAGTASLKAIEAPRTSSLYTEAVTQFSKAAEAFLNHNHVLAALWENAAQASLKAAEAETQCKSYLRDSYILAVTHFNKAIEAYLGHHDALATLWENAGHASLNAAKAGMKCKFDLKGLYIQAVAHFSKAAQAFLAHDHTLVALWENAAQTSLQAAAAKEKNKLKLSLHYERASRHFENAAQSCYYLRSIWQDAGIASFEAAKAIIANDFALHDYYAQVAIHLDNAATAIKVIHTKNSKNLFYPDLRNLWTNAANASLKAVEAITANDPLLHDHYAQLATYFKNAAEARTADQYYLKNLWLDIIKLSIKAKDAFLNGNPLLQEYYTQAAIYLRKSAEEKDGAAKQSVSLYAGKAYWKLAEAIESTPFLVQPLHQLDAEKAVTKFDGASEEKELNDGSTHPSGLSAPVEERNDLSEVTFYYHQAVTCFENAIKHPFNEAWITAGKNYWKIADAVKNNSSLIPYYLQAATYFENAATCLREESVKAFLAAGNCLQHINTVNRDLLEDASRAYVEAAMATNHKLAKCYLQAAKYHQLATEARQQTTQNRERRAEKNFYALQAEEQAVRARRQGNRVEEQNAKERLQIAQREEQQAQLREALFQHQEQLWQTTASFTFSAARAEVAAHSELAAHYRNAAWFYKKAAKAYDRDHLNQAQDWKNAATAFLKANRLRSIDPKKAEQWNQVVEYYQKAARAETNLKALFWRLRARLIIPESLS